MQSKSAVAALLGALVAIVAFAGPAAADQAKNIQVGPRLFYLVDKMTDGALKTTLEQCKKGPLPKPNSRSGIAVLGFSFQSTRWSPTKPPSKMGAGIVECDVTFTNDKNLVCCHAQCDLATTTNILTTPLAATCAVPFTPASGSTPATAKCCTSDLSLAQFKSLKGKMDSSNPRGPKPG